MLAGSPGGTSAATLGDGVSHPREETWCGSSLTCYAVHQHLPLVELLLQLPDFTLLSPVCHGQFCVEKGHKHEEQIFERKTKAR